MMKDYFVMLSTKDGGLSPLMNDDGIATFDTQIEAEAAGEENLLGAHFDFEVFRRGQGCHADYYRTTYKCGL